MTGETNWKNVNNWHWVEKNCFPWAADHLETELKNHSVTHPDASFTAKISSVSVSGDVHLNQRKGKIITIFDINIKCDVLIQGKELDQKTSITVEEFDHDMDTNDLPLTFGEMDDAARTLVRKDLTDLIRKTLSGFREALINSHSKDVYIPPEQMSGHPVLPLMEHNKEKIKFDATQSSSQASGTSLKGSVTTIKQKEEFVCSPVDLYDAFLNPQKVTAWTRSKVVLTPTPNTDYSLFDGNVSGTILSLTPNKEIQMTWRLRDWPKDHYSTVTILLQDTQGSTLLELTQTGVPLGEKDTAERNWKQYYWRGIKGTFGYGAVF